MVKKSGDRKKGSFFLPIAIVVILVGGVLFFSPAFPTGHLVLDKLELNENIGSEYHALTKHDWDGLADGILYTGEGKAAYSQFIAFEDNVASDRIESCTVQFTKNDEEESGTFLHCKKDDDIFEYQLIFTSPLKSQIEEKTLRNLIGKELFLLGQTFKISGGTISGNKAKLTMIGIPVQKMIPEGGKEVLLVDSKPYTVEVVMISDSSPPKAVFRVNGQVSQPTEAGKTAVINNIPLFLVLDILPNEGGEGGDYVSIVFGPRKIVMEDNDYTDDAFTIGGAKVNGHDMIDAKVKIKGTNEGDLFSIHSISYRLAAATKKGDDIYVPGGQGLTLHHRSPYGLLSSAWDLEFGGLNQGIVGKAAALPSSSIIKFDAGNDGYDLEFGSNSGLRYDLHFITQTGDTLRYGTAERDIIFTEGADASSYNIDKNDYFIVNDRSDGKGRTHILQFDGVQGSTNAVFTDLSGSTRVVSLFPTGAAVKAAKEALGFDTVVVPLRSLALSQIPSSPFEGRGAGDILSISSITGSAVEGEEGQQQEGSADDSAQEARTEAPASEAPASPARFRIIQIPESNHFILQSDKPILNDITFCRGSECVTFTPKVGDTCANPMMCSTDVPGNDAEVTAQVGGKTVASASASPLPSSVSSPQFTVVDSPSPPALAPGATSTVQVAFNPTPSSPGSSPPITVPVPPAGSSGGSSGVSNPQFTVPDSQTPPVLVPGATSTVGITLPSPSSSTPSLNLPSDQLTTSDSSAADSDDTFICCESCPAIDGARFFIPFVGYTCQTAFASSGMSGLVIERPDLSPKECANDLYIDAPPHMIYGPNCPNAQGQQQDQQDDKQKKCDEAKSEYLAAKTAYEALVPIVREALAKLQQSNYKDAAALADYQRAYQRAHDAYFNKMIPARDAAKTLCDGVIPPVPPAPQQASLPSSSDSASSSGSSSGVSSGVSSPQFTVVNSPSPPALAPGATSTVQVTFNPTIPSSGSSPPIIVTTPTAGSSGAGTAPSIPPSSGPIPAQGSTSPSQPTTSSGSCDELIKEYNYAILFYQDKLTEVRYALLFYEDALKTGKDVQELKAKYDAAYNEAMIYYNNMIRLFEAVKKCGVVTEPLPAPSSLSTNPGSSTTSSPSGEASSERSATPPTSCSGGELFVSEQECNTACLPSGSSCTMTVQFTPVVSNPLLENPTISVNQPTSQASSLPASCSMGALFVSEQDCNTACLSSGGSCTATVRFTPTASNSNINFIITNSGAGTTGSLSTSLSLSNDFVITPDWSMEPKQYPIDQPPSKTEPFSSSMTTDFSSKSLEELKSIKMTVGVEEKAKVEYLENVDVRGIPLSDVIKFEANPRENAKSVIVTVDTSTAPELNKPASITLYNVKPMKQPVILRDGAPCDSCEIIFYNVDGGTLNFVTPGFSSFEAIDASGLGRGTLILSGTNYEFFVNSAGDRIVVDQNGDGTLDGSSVSINVLGNGILEFGSAGSTIDVTLLTLKRYLDNSTAPDEMTTVRFGITGGEVGISLPTIKTADAGATEEAMTTYGAHFVLEDKTTRNDLTINYPAAGQRRAGVILQTEK